MFKLVNDLIKMNQAGLVLELGEKYYHDNIMMFNNGVIFAESKHEAYEKQQGFVSSIIAFDIKLVSKVIIANVSELTFHYKMTGDDSNIMDFTGKHVQTWNNNKIIREEYFSIEKTSESN